MRKILGIPKFGRWPKRKKEEAEFGKGKHGIIMCPEEEAVYFNKSWHHALDEHKNLTSDKDIRFELCPAHKMQRSEQFEGIIKIENIPKDLREELVHLVKNIGQRAFERDVLDRILDVDYKEGTLIVKTSENQLAVSIGKQIQRSHKKAHIKTQFSKRESTARVRVWWEE